MISKAIPNDGLTKEQMFLLTRMTLVCSSLQCYVGFEPCFWHSVATALALFLQHTADRSGLS
jgi:hypothetical protein